MLSFRTCFCLRPGLKRQVVDILKRCDNDVTPPLSQRGGLVAMGPDENAEPIGIENYVEELSIQHFILAFDTPEDGGPDVLIGFMAYRTDYVPEILSDMLPDGCVYVNMLAVQPEYRCMGVASNLYRILLTMMTNQGRVIALRTGSDNVKHHGVLERMSFRESARIAGERGPGIDTVYYTLTAPVLDCPAILRQKSDTGMAG